MKKLLFLIYLMALMPLPSFSLDYDPISIYYPQVNGIYYYFNPETGEASVESKAYLGNDVYESADYSGHLVIPDSVTYEGKEYRVTGISTKAFYGCTLDGLTIPSSVSSISNRTGGTIHELYISSWEWWCGLSHFGDGELYFYNNLLQKADKVFVDGEECDLTNLNLPDDVTTINDYAFCNIKKIERITIPDGVKSIGPYAFYLCTALQEVVLGSGVETIGKHAFGECRLLKTLTLSSNLKDIDYDAFDYGQIINLIVPDLKSWCHLSAPGKRYITGREEGVHLFCSANEEITNLVIPEGVTTIARESFCNMNWVKSVSFPESLETICEFAFFRCDGVETVSISDNVKSIGEHAFDYCQSLTSVAIGDGIDYIGNGAFGGNNNLNTVVFGNTIPTMGDEVFQSSSSNFKNSLLSVVSHSNAPQSIPASVFHDDTYRNGTLHVPAGTKFSYIQFDGWRNFLNIVEDGISAECSLTITDAAHGATKLHVASGETITMTFLPNEGWQVHSVSFNDIDVTAWVDANGQFTTPVITSDATLNVVYECNDISSIAANKGTGLLRLTAVNGGVRIDGAETGIECRVYDLEGVMVKQVVLPDSSCFVELPSHQPFVIRIGNKCFKAQIR